MSDTLAYFAAEPDSEKAVAGVISRIKRYREQLRASGRLTRMRRNWYSAAGYGPNGDINTTAIQHGGAKGELMRINVNQFAALVNQTVVLTTSNKPATRAVAANSDFESQAQARTAEQLNEAYDRALNLAATEADAAFNMVLLSETVVIADWEKSVGRQVVADEHGNTKSEGDVRVYALTPWEYAVDPDVQDVASHTWVCWGRRVNKWDLAARYPNERDGILRADVGRGADRLDTSGDFIDVRRQRSSETESDYVVVWELRHKRTPACPNGRMLLFLDDETVLADSIETVEGEVRDYGYVFGDDLMATFAMPEKLPGTADGHTSFFDLCSLQEGLDLSASTMVSAINAGGLQNLYVNRGANIAVEQLSGALNVVYYDGEQMPEAKENVAINPAVSAWADMCVSWMRQRVAMNDVVMGEPNKGMPAQAMALLRAQAVEFHSRLQQAFERMVETNRTNILLLLKKFANTERVALIAGKSSRWALKYFTADDISKVQRFVVEPVNPVLRTLAGKVAFAQPLFDTGQINSQEYLQLVQTGRMEPIYEFESANQARVQQEKEMLMEGTGLPPIQMAPNPMTGMVEPVLGPDGFPVFVDPPVEPGKPPPRFIRPLINDTHWIDIREAQAVLAMPDARNNPKVTQAVLSVVDLRMKMWRAMDPAIIMLLKGPMPPPLMSPEMAQSMAPPPAEGSSSGTDSPLPGARSASGPRLPEPPPNPLTGQRDQSTQIQSAPI